MSNIEKKLFPNSDRLYFDVGSDCYKSIIVDVELDPVTVEFENDGCVRLITEDLQYVMLSVENLRKLIYLIEKSESLYKDE